MPDIFSDAEDRRAFVDAVAAERGVAPWVIEKDLWVCWTLARLHEIHDIPQITFKGGTSLSEVYGLIDRFSEDIDLTFSRDGWGFNGERDPLCKDLSGKQRLKLIKEIGLRAETTVRDVVVPGLREACSTHLGETGWNVEIDNDDQQAVLFTFPAPGAAYGYGEPVVKIEFGARGDPWPTSLSRIQPYIEEQYANTASSAIVEVRALNPERTFWEKATLLHGIHHATLASPDKAVARLSRHAYDVHRMWHATNLRDRLVDPVLLTAVVDNKQVFFRDPKSKYELVQEYKLTCAPHDRLAKTLRKDFEAMESMFFPEAEVPTFDQAIESLREIDAMVAGWANLAG